MAQDFIDYITSADGQAVIEDNGYISVSDAEEIGRASCRERVSLAG